MRFQTTAGELCVMVGGEVFGDPDAVLTGIGSVDSACCGDVVLAENEKYFHRALECDATCIVCSTELAQDRGGRTVIAVDKPADAFTAMLDAFRGEEHLPEIGVGAGSVIEPDVELGRGVRIGANCYVGKGAVLGENCVLFPGVYIGENVRIGRDSKLYANVSVYWGCSIGERAILHAGVVIGADGFGYRPGPAGLIKLPHAGTVEIGDDVEIGANSAVDRAKAGATTVGSGTKIDNLVHIAHNVKIGRHCVIVALTGVAGSVEIGNGVTLAAQSGVRDHVRIEDGAVVAARAGVINDIGKGATVSGFPARDHRADMKSQAVIVRLPEILKRLRDLEREVRSLREGGDS